MALIGRALLIPVALLLAAGAEAHRLSPAYFGLTESAPDRYQAQWKASISGGLADTLMPVLPSGCSVQGPVRLHVLDDRQTPNDVRLQLADVQCARPIAGGTFGVDGLSATDTDVLLRIDYLDGGSFTHRLVPDSPSVVIPARPGALDVARTYTVLGIEHILGGIDHLLFVLALVLLVRGVKALVVTVTAFTVAHSITLAATVLGVVRVSPAAVEATIALSIVFLATELARQVTADRGPGLTARYPWIVAFAFGLLHGFGFAGALLEIGLPEQAIPLALLFFNVGVELGQLVFVAAVVAIGVALARHRRVRLSPLPLAYVIGSVSAFWLFERTWFAIRPAVG